MAHAVRIIVEDDGYPRELLSRADWTRALADGSLNAGTDVTVYRDGAAPQYMKARDVAELEPLFRPPAAAQQDHPTAPRPPEEQTTVPPASMPEPVASSPSVAKTAERQETRRPALSALLAGEAADEQDDALAEEENIRDFDAWQPAPAIVRRNPSPAIFLLAGLAALLIILWLANAASERSPARSAANAYTVTGTANVRTAASTAGSQIVDQLHRNDTVVGLPRNSGGETWIEITEGPHAGRFIWANNLTRVAR